MKTKTYLIIMVSLLTTCLGINNSFTGNPTENVYNVLPQIPDNIKHFMVTNYLSDNNFVRIIVFENVFTRETNVNTFRNPLRQLQVSDGVSLIQLIYSNTNELVDCDYIRRKYLVNNFLSELFREIEFVKIGNMISMNEKFNNTNNQHFITVTENNITAYYQAKHIPRNEIFEKGNITYISFKNITDTPINLKPVLNFRKLKLECHRKTQLKKKFVNDSEYSYKQQTPNSIDYIKRKKRSLSDLLIAPNTKWCGRGHNADNYNELGGASQADKCCRKHDHCKSNIQGMSTKWNLFNFRMYTISHCNCDIRFRTCLKMADTADANLVGKLFFNVVQTKCFVIKWEKICKKRAEDGRCEKRTMRKRAHLRENRKF